MTVKKFTIEMTYDTEDPVWINFDFDEISGVSGNDPVEEFIEFTLPNALREYIDELQNSHED